MIKFLPLKTMMLPTIFSIPKIPHLIIIGCFMSKPAETITIALGSGYFGLLVSIACLRFIPLQPLIYRFWWYI